MALVLWALLATAGQESKPPFKVVWAEAHHVLPETTSDESGYFSLCEGGERKVYVGTAKYGENSFLVEFDPRTRKQRAVLDTHGVCGLTARGYAAQAKLHTRNFVGASGTIYVGSKQGYRKEGDTSEYPGGYVMTYDPATGRAENLGMPFPGQGVIDVVADEARSLLYVVTCEEQHWVLYDMKARTYRELGPMLTPYATTLVDPRGRAHAITRDFKLARVQSGPASQRDILIDGEVWTRRDAASIPTWNLAADGKTAYLILMNDARLIRLDLETGQGRRLGTMVEGKNPDSRAALSIAPDGRVYAVVRVDNTTGFGSGYLHHLARYDPEAGTIEDLGVLAVRNPGYFDFTRKKPWTHGFHTLPDGTLTPLHAHMALMMASDGAAYVTVIYPFTLLRIEPEALLGRPRTVAGITTVYHRHSHADVILTRLMKTDTMDGQGRVPSLRLASLYTDQPGPRKDVGREFAVEHAVRVSPDIEDALTLGTGKLAVDGVLLIAEHGNYPTSPTGQTQYPKRKFFERIVSLFERSGRVVPVFIDKHLSDTWEDARWIHDTARRMKIPLMAGSSLPVLWRDPPIDLPVGAELEEVVGVSYHTLDGYGFHALEALEAVIERRRGGETGVRAVQTLEGEAVWQAGLFDPKLLAAALERQVRPFTGDLRTAVAKPTLWRIEYADGLKVSILTLNHAVSEWALAWRTRGGETQSVGFRTQEGPPYAHFGHLVEGIERMVLTGRPAWPAERTLLTSGTLHALMGSLGEGGKRRETPELAFPYRTDWTWRQPPPAPPIRPIQQD